MEIVSPKYSNTHGCKSREESILEYRYEIELFLSELFNNLGAFTLNEKEKEKFKMIF